MKKLFMALFAIATICIVAMIGATSASAETISGTFGSCTYTLEDTVLTIDGDGSTWGDSTVGSGGTPYAGFMNRVTKMVIGEGVANIQGSVLHAFDGELDSLLSIEVASGNENFYVSGNCLIEKATNRLVQGCQTSVIPDGVTSIEKYAFSCCAIKSITIPDSVTSIGDYAFYGCSLLTSITVSSGNSEYYSQGNCLIEKDTGILMVGCATSVIPDGVKYIDIKAFAYCTSLTSIDIPDSVQGIWSSAFYNCEALTSVTIGDNVTSIGSSAFYYCPSLTSINIPNSVTSIGSSAFSYCSSLTSITIPNNVTSIGDSAFKGCENLKTVFIHSPDIAQNLSRDTSCGYLGYCADTIYVASNIVTVGNHLATMPYKMEGVTVNGAKYTSYSKVSNHTCSYEWASTASQHWQICSGCSYVGTKTGHVFDNNSDATCDTCGYTRQAETTTKKPTTTKPSTTKPSTTTPNVTNPPVSSTTTTKEEDTTVEDTTIGDTTTVPVESTTLDETSSPDTTAPDITVPDTTDGGKGSGKKDDGNTAIIIIVAVVSVVATAGIASAIFAVILKKRK